MTKARNPDLEKLSNHELNNLFLKESDLFMKLLFVDADSKELTIVKERVREILEVMDARKKSKE